MISLLSMRRALRTLWLLLLLGSAMSAHAKLFLWQAEQEGRKVWLLGSIHVGRADFYPLAEPIEAAYRNTDTLVVEADVSDPTAALPYMGLAMLPPDTTLSKQLSAPVYRKLMARLPDTGLPPQAAERMKPWFLALTLTMKALDSYGYQSSDGIDLHFLRRAKQDSYRIVELESVKFQLELFNSLSQREAELFVGETLRQLDDGSFKQQLDAMLKAWQSGDTRALIRAVEAGMPERREARQLMNKLLRERNVAMADKIANLASRDKPPLVVVGAAHLAGSGSVVELLQARGFRLSQQ
ncbi:TraB/GumN family protein [Chitinimonas lacunae]|uniref:TraB/GumN family protein n=1 Tax=Chitinimonas lacunae TaxID=1963018 RepID=A0ABV8MTW7_9NEIS